MSLTNQHQLQQKQQLEERVRSLEQQINEKDEAYFELSATVVAIQAESNYVVKNMEKNTKLQLDRTTEELRRTTQEANQAHMSLARLQQQRQHQQHPATGAAAVRHNFQQVPPIAVGPSRTNDKPPSTIFVTSSSNPPMTTVVSQPHQHTGQILARHLLLKGSMHQKQDSIYRLLQHAQNSNLQDADIVWQILQSSHENNKLWLKEALLLSPPSRSMLRQACCKGANDDTSNGRKDVVMMMEPRIRVNSGGDTSIDLHAIAERLKNPLWKPGAVTPTATSTPKSNPFDPSVCRVWMKDVCCNTELWYLLFPLLYDCNSTEERDPWCTLLSKDMIVRWETFMKGYIPKGRPRRIHSTTTSLLSGGISCNTMSVPSFLQSLQLMGDIFKKTPGMDHRTIMAIMLDLLEYETFLEKRNMELIVAVLAFLSMIVEDVEGLKLLRTKMVTSEDDEMAQSGLGVAIVILTVSQVKLEMLMDGGEVNRHIQEYKMLEMMRNHVIRLFHQVLHHGTAGVCFTSLIEERKHDYLGVCSQILIAPKDLIDPSIRTMVRIQMEEIEGDREDEEDLKLKQK